MKKCDLVYLQMFFDSESLDKQIPLHLVDPDYPNLISKWSKLFLRSNIDKLFCSVRVRYLQPIITQYFIDNKSEIWLLFLIAHSKR